MLLFFLGLSSAHGQALSLTAGQPVLGTTFTARVTGARAGGTVVLVASMAGPGAGGCPPQLGGTCLDVTSPVLLDSKRADASGAATLSVVLPDSAPLGPVWLQAVATGMAPTGKSAVAQERSRPASRPRSRESGADSWASCPRRGWCSTGGTPSSRRRAGAP